MLSLVHHAAGSNYNIIRRQSSTKLIAQLLSTLYRWIQKRLKYLVSFLFISRYSRYQQPKLLLLLITFCVIRHFRKHRVWWSGLIDTAKLAVFYVKTFHGIKFTKSVFQSKDNEKYSVWKPAAPRSYSLSPKVTELRRADHIWVCCPGGMFDVDPACVALYEADIFAGSDLVCFNNPGVSTRMVSKPLISPTEPKYLIEYLFGLKDEGYKISLIGFSVGTVFALRTLHTLKNDERYKASGIELQCVILVHAPDLVREAVMSSSNYWLFRHDLYFAGYIHFLQKKSNSWSMIKHKVNYQWFDGWDYIKQCTEICCDEEWNKCEKEQFNLRNFCDESITDTPVIRIIAKNDFVIPFEDIDAQYFKYFHKVLVTERGGHCGVHSTKETRDEIESWNDRIVNNKSL